MRGLHWWIPVVLLPLLAATRAEAQANCGTTLFQVVSSTPNLSNLTSLIEAANFVTALNQTNTNTTLFAPTNTAIAAFEATLARNNQTIANITNPVSDLAGSILQYHGVAYSVNLTTNQVLPTLLTGYNLSIVLTGPSANQTVTVVGVVNNASVLNTTAIRSCQSVAYPIDAVLLPSGFADIPAYVPPTSPSLNPSASPTPAPTSSGKVSTAIDTLATGFIAAGLLLCGL